MRWLVLSMPEATWSRKRWIICIHSGEKGTSRKWERYLSNCCLDCCLEGLKELTERQRNRGRESNQINRKTDWESSGRTACCDWQWLKLKERYLCIRVEGSGYLKSLWVIPWYSIWIVNRGSRNLCFYGIRISGYDDLTRTLRPIFWTN